MGACSLLVQKYEQSVCVCVYVCLSVYVCVYVDTVYICECVHVPVYACMHVCLCRQLRNSRKQDRVKRLALQHRV